MHEIEIGGRGIGPGKPCFIIAEAGVNHNGSLETAIRLIEVAARAGADAVKFQTFKADRLISPAARKARYQTLNTSAGESQLDMVRRLELPYEWHRQLMDC
jgi:N,N'-diacetyllegionaminate synthase